MLCSRWRSWGQGCSAVDGGVGTGKCGSRHWGAILGMLSPMGSPSRGHAPCPCPLEGLSWLSPHTGLLRCCRPGPTSGSPVQCPAAQLGHAGAFQTTTAPASSAAPPSGFQTLPGAKSCSIYCPQAELTAAS